MCKESRKEEDWALKTNFVEHFHSVPPLFLSGKKDEQDRIQGFAAGGDDYVTKPFSKRELVMKVQAMMKRAQQAPSSIVAENNNPEALSHHKIRMDLGQHRVFWEDQEVSLTKNEFHILKVMLGDPSRVHPRDKLMDRVVEDRTIDSHVRGIRDKFKAFGVDPIETRRGVGFILKQWDWDDIYPNIDPHWGFCFSAHSFFSSE